MSNLPISSKYRSTPERAVDEAERENLTTRLNDAFTAGSLDADRYQEMLDRVFAARTLGELAPVVEQLPAASTYAEPEMVRQTGRTAPGQLSPAGMNAKTVRTVGTVVTAVSVLIVLLVVLALTL